MQSNTNLHFPPRLPYSLNKSGQTPIVIKIKNPRSDIKVFKPNLTECLKTSPELPIRGNVGQSDNDMDWITQAWNRLKINSLSKAIAMGENGKAEKGERTFGPLTPTTDDGCNGLEGRAERGRLSFGPLTPTTDDGCNGLEGRAERGKLSFGPPSPNTDTVFNDSKEHLDLSQAVTSTPVKPKNTLTGGNKKGKLPEESDNSKTSLANISEIPEYSKVTSTSKDIKEIEKLRKQCLDRIEDQVKRSAERKKEECLKSWMEEDRKIKEKLKCLKKEIELSQLVRAQQNWAEAQSIVKEQKLSKQHKTKENVSVYEQRIAETGEMIRQNEERRRELEEAQRQRREQLKYCINSIYKSQLAYRHKYNQINETLKKCRDTSLISEKHTAELEKLRTMNEVILKLVERTNEGKVTTKDVKIADSLLQQMNVISEVFAQHVDQINKAVDKNEEVRKKEELEREKKTAEEEAERQRIAKEQAEKVEREKVIKATKLNKLAEGIEDCISGECLQWHVELSTFLETYEKKLEPLVNNESLKNFRFDCQKVVNVPVNAISPLDDLHLEDKRYKLSRLLSGSAVPTGDTLFLPTGHPLGVPFCTNLLAKKFVKQGEHAVSSKPESAFAIAAVIVALWAEFPEFGRLLLAHFHRECPYLIPAFLPQVEGQSNEDYYRMLGYQYSEDGKVEPQDKFLRRMSGVMRLYVAVLVTPPKRSLAAEGRTHPHGVRQAWRWLTASLHLGPRPDISATLIFDFLEVAGWLLFTTYRKQFTKLLHLLCTDYFPMIQQVTPDGCGGPVVRLKSFLEKCLKEGKIPPPKGLLPQDFW